MPDGLAATWDECRKRIALDRGWSIEPDDWDAQQLFILEACLRDGARYFYKPGATGGPPHEWSFLKPIKELLIVSGEADMGLWSDFCYLVGELYFIQPDIATADPLIRVNDGQIMKMRQQLTTGSTGRPTHCAIVPEANPGNLSPQKYRLMMYPTPDQNYTVQGRYKVAPWALDHQHQHPYGGPDHANTLIFACLKASEVINGTPGPHTQRFNECLLASIEEDKRVQSQLVENEDGRMRPIREYPYVQLTTYNGLYS